jgi:hypothetical protein
LAWKTEVRSPGATAARGLHRFQLPKVRVRKGHRNKSGGVPFQKVPQDVELLDLLGPVGAHKSATIRHTLDDTHLFQIRERATHDMSLRPETSHQVAR